MLPSKEKFHYYPCPFYLAGNCDRPFCHFKHADTAETGETEKKTLPGAEREEKLAPCNSQLNNHDTSSSLVKVSQADVPQYKPTPIAELQKRNSGDDKQEDYKFNFLENSSSKSYSPNGFHNLSSLTYNPSEIATLSIKQEIYDPPGLENDFQEYRPSKIDLNLPDSVYTPESKVGILPLNCLDKEVPAVHTYSPIRSSNKSKLLYSPTTGPVSKKTKLEYDPSLSVQTNLKFQSKPLLVDTETLPDVNNLNYVPTDIAILNKSPTTTESSEVPKQKSSSKSHSKSTSSKSSSSKSSDKRRSSSSSRNKHKSSHSDRSSSKKSVSTNSEKKTESSSSKSEKSSKPSSSRSSKSSQSSSSHKTTHDKHKSSSSSSSSNKDKSREKEKSHHHSSSKQSTSSKDKTSKGKDSRHKSTSSSSTKGKSKASNSKTRNSSCSPSHDEPLDTANAVSSDESSRDVLAECFRFFEAFEDDSPNVPSTVPQAQGSDKAAVVEELVPGKRRIAHDSSSRIPPVARSSRAIRPVSASAGQMLTERWKKQQALHQKEKEATTSKADQLLNQLVDEPKPTLPWLKKNQTNDASTSSSTIAQTCSKGKARVAHKAKEEVLRRPIVAASTGDRIPATRRQHALDKFTDSCLNIYHTTEEAFEKAIELEKACFDKSLTHTVYNNLFVNSLLKLKHTTANSSGGNNTMSQKLQISLEQGCIKKTVIQRTNVVLKGAELYRRLQKYMLTEEQLKELSFPVAHEEEGRAYIYNNDKGKRNVAASSLLSTDPNLRECTRCRKLYVVDKHGMPPELDKDSLCTYHPKRAFKKRIRNFFEYYYDCCSMQLSHNGCEKNKYHVTERFDPENLTGFVTTVDKGIPAEHSGVYALDCEMCITTEGSEVTRITIINEDGKSIYDTLLKPDTPVLDYNTKYSGITESMMTNVKTTLRDVQRVLLNMFTTDTILIGHSLNGDLQVLKLIHKSVVDTSIVYPHREGLPKRRALKNLAIDHLSRLIQMDDAGHNSEEDALTCMDLMLLKIKEDIKLE